MTIKRKRFTLGVELSPADLTAEDLSREGELAYDSSDDRLKYRNASATKEVVDSDSTQALENKTIDATAATGNNSLSADSVDIVYDDTSEAVSSLGTNVQAALDAIKTALDNQNEASEIQYTPAVPADYDVAPSFVKPALDELASRVRTNEGGISTNATGLSDHLADAVDAHDASAISVVPSGNQSSTDAQSAINELQSDIDTRALADGGTISNATITTPAQLDVKQDTEANLVTYAATATDGQFVFATDTQKMYQIIDNALAPVGGGGATNFELTQVAHGFAVGDGIYHNGTSFVKGQSNSATTLAYYVVVEVIDVNTFVAADFGRLEVPAHGFTVGQYYFLSDSVAGQPTTTEPSNGFSNPLFYVEDANTLQIKVYRPTQVGEDVALDQLSDVSAPSPSDGDILTYNNGSGLYVLESRDLEQTQSILNNQSTAQNITGLLLDEVNHQAYRVFYSVNRVTDTQEESESGVLMFNYNATRGWVFSQNFAGEDSGVTFSVSGSQVQYQTDDLTGANYSGSVDYIITDKV